LSEIAAEGRPSPAPSQERRWRFGWREIALTLLIVFLAYQVVVPFVMIIWTSLKTARPGEPEFLSLSFTSRTTCAPSAASRSGATTGNTLSFALAATLLAFVMGASSPGCRAHQHAVPRFIGFMLIGRIVIRAS